MREHERSKLEVIPADKPSRGSRMFSQDLQDTKDNKRPYALVRCDPRDAKLAQACVGKLASYGLTGSFYSSVFLKGDLCGVVQSLHNVELEMMLLNAKQWRTESKIDAAVHPMGGDVPVVWR